MGFIKINNKPPFGRIFLVHLFQASYQAIPSFSSCFFAYLRPSNDKCPHLFVYSSPMFIHQCLYFLFIFFVIHQCSFCSPKICGRLYTIRFPIWQVCSNPCHNNTMTVNKCHFCWRQRQLLWTFSRFHWSKGPPMVRVKVCFAEAICDPLKTACKTRENDMGYWGLPWACQNPAWQWIIYSSLWRDPHWSSRKSTVAVYRFRNLSAFM